jgi:hypothetical protein
MGCKRGYALRADLRPVRSITASSFWGAPRAAPAPLVRGLRPRNAPGVDETVRECPSCVAVNVNVYVYVYVYGGTR